MASVLSGGERTNYPVTVSVDDAGAGFAVSVLAVSPGGSRELVAGLVLAAAEGLAGVLEEAAETPLRQVPVLDPAEREQVLAGWNDTGREVPAGTLAESVRGAGGGGAGCGGGGLWRGASDVCGAGCGVVAAGAAADRAGCGPGVCGGGGDGPVGGRW